MIKIKYCKMLLKFEKNSKRLLKSFKFNKEAKCCSCNLAKTEYAPLEQSMKY